MNWFKTKIRNTDRLFSAIIRKRDNGLCVYNFKCFKGTLGTDCSHFQKRRKESTRYDLDNCDLACRACHYFVENDPNGQKTLEEFKLKQLGELRYKLLLVRANSYHKRDDKLMKIYLKELEKTV